MSSTQTTQQQQERLLEDAMDWLMRLRETPAEPELIAAWEGWLEASDDHLFAWTQICRSWVAVGHGPAPSPDRAVLAAPPLPIAPRAVMTRRLSRRRIGLVAISFMTVGLFALALGPALKIRLDADFRTGAGETRIVTLADGSRVTLAPDTALADDFDGGGRHMRLLAGEAYFEVERDLARPFVVDTPDASVRVLGTAFSVRETGHGTRVELAHGAVALRPQGADSLAELTLAPGDVVTVDRQHGQAERSRIDPADIALWREGRLEITDQPLGDVLALLQRQHPAWIMMPERELASLRVTGFYDLSDPDKALMALLAPFGLKVRSATPYLRIISRD